MLPSWPTTRGAPRTPPSRLRAPYLPAASTPSREVTVTRDTAVAPRLARTNTACLPSSVRRRYTTTCPLPVVRGTSVPTASASFERRRWIRRRYRLRSERGLVSCAATVVVRESGCALDQAVPDVNPSPGRALHCIGV